MLAAVLVLAALLKLASPRSSQAALGTFGVPQRARWPAWGVLVATEFALAAGVALGWAAPAYVAAALLASFAGLLALALRRGRAGAPCACFGSRSRVAWTGVLRNLLLAGAFAAVPFLPSGAMATEGWLALGLGVALAGVAGLAVAVLALAREIGMLRLQLAPQAALEIPEEGPPLGERIELSERFRLEPPACFALAVFSSEGCRLCRSLAPAVSVLARDPLVAVEVFDERGDADIWRALEIPGSPYAVALGEDGAVLAKGTFNSFSQLEGILAAAERRARAYVDA